MEEAIHDVKQELKRVDHLIYVSLKYTRTADVLKNVIERLVGAFDFMIMALLEKAKEEEKLEEVSTAPLKRCEQINEVFSEDEKILELCSFFGLLRRLNKLDYKKESEYRRHVAMIFDVDGKEVRVDIDSVTEYYKQAKDYVSYIEQNYIQQND